VAKLMPLLGRLMHAFDLKPLLGMVDGELKLVGTARSYDEALNRIQEQAAALTPVRNQRWRGLGRRPPNVPTVVQ